MKLNLYTRFQHFTVKAKLLTISITVAVFFLLIGVLAYNFSGKIANFFHLNTPYLNLSNQLGELHNAETAFFLYELAGSSYLKTKNINYSYQIREHYKQTLNILDEIQALEQVKKSPELMQLNEKIDQDLRSYNKRFIDFVKTVEERGFGRNGLTADALTVGEQLYLQAQQSGNSTLVSTIAQMRLAGRDYIFSFDSTEIETIHNQAEMLKMKFGRDSVFLTTLDSTFIFQQSAFFNQLDDYSKLFQRIHEQDKLLGLIGNIGLFQKVRADLDNAVQHSTKAMQLIRETSIAQVRKSRLRMVAATSFLALLSFTVLMLVARSITRPVERIRLFVAELAEGKLPEKFKLKNEDEITEMLKSLNTFVDNLRSKSAFAKQIGEGNLNASLNALSDHDILGHSLTDMQKSLVAADKEEEKRRREDEKRIWATNGISRIGDILRQNNDDLEKLSFQIIKNLVSYLGVNQGGLFVYNADNNENIFLELKAAYAFNRRKFLEKKVEVGEGLIGTCAVEQKTIFLTEIPENYLELSSGFGSTTPKSLLIVPLKFNEQLYGVVELASMKVTEKHEIEFVETVAENIASTLSTVKTAERTSNLLKQSKQQAEELASQEEEMRQNMEELQATQEESARREVRMQSLLNSINASTYAIEYDLEGKLLEVNAIAEKILGISKDELIGTMHRDYVDFQAESDLNTYNLFWQKLRKGRTVHRESKKIIRGRTIWLDETYSPILDKDGRVERILNIAFDITEVKKLHQEVEREKQQIERVQQKVAEENKTIEVLYQTLDAIQMRAELSLDGTFLEINENYANLFGMSCDKITGKNVFQVVSDTGQREMFKEVLQHIKKDRIFLKKINIESQTDENKEVMFSITPVKNLKNEAYKLFLLGYEV